jgi:hypothetical protein
MPIYHNLKNQRQREFAEWYTKNSNVLRPPEMAMATAKNIAILDTCGFKDIIGKQVIFPQSNEDFIVLPVNVLYEAYATSFHPSEKKKGIFPTISALEDGIKKLKKITNKNVYVYGKLALKNVEEHDPTQQIADILGSIHNADLRAKISHVLPERVDKHDLPGAYQSAGLLEETGEKTMLKFYTCDRGFKEGEALDWNGKKLNIVHLNKDYSSYKK